MSPVRPATAQKTPSRPPPAYTPPTPPIAPRRPSQPPREEVEEVTRVGPPQIQLSEAMRAEVKSIVRTAVDSAVAGLSRQLEELTQALERERRERSEGDARALQSAAAAAKKGTLPGLAHQSEPPPALATPVPVPFSIAPPEASPVARPAPRAAVARAPSRPVDLVIDSSPVEIPAMLDGARRRRRNAWLVGVAFVLVMGALLGSMILSQSH